MERDLEEKVKENPSTRLFAPLADHYRKKGQIDKAIDTLMRGLSFHPSYTSARVLLARCYEDLGEWEKARKEWKRVLDIDNRNLVALKGMGEICRLFGEYEESRRWFRTYLEEFPDDDSVKERLIELDSDFSGNSDRTERGDPQSTAIPVHKFGESLVLDKQDQKVIDSEVETAGGLEGTYEEEDFFNDTATTEIYTQQGFYERAIEIFRRILSQDPGNQRIMERINDLKEKLSKQPVTGPSVEEVSNRDVSPEESKDSRNHVVEDDEEFPHTKIDETIEPVNINNATSLELEVIPGVGPVIAQKIVVERERNGPFRSREDLGRVPSMGERIVERIIPYLKFEKVPVEESGDLSEMMEEGKSGGDVSGIPEEDLFQDSHDDEPISEGENFDLEFEEFRKWLKNLRK
jgi:competence ComEA-like helix-hairpin-helix protein